MAVACRPPSGELAHAPVNPTCAEQSGFLDGVEGGGWGEKGQGGRRLVQFLEVVDMPVVVQRQVPQLQFVVRVVDILFVTQRLILMVQTVQKSTGIPQLPVDMMVDVSVVLVVQVPQVQVDVPVVPVVYVPQVQSMSLL